MNDGAVRPAESLLARLPRKVRVVEVAPRDGLQNEKALVPVDQRVEFVHQLRDSGLKHIEAGAFVRPDLVPQLQDSEVVFQRLQTTPGVTYTALVGNQRGWERAQAAGVTSIAVFAGVTESFNRKNAGASIKEIFERLRPVVREARASKVAVRGYVSTVFHCPYEGWVSADDALAVVRRFQEIGVEHLALGDTTGAATPLQVTRVLERVNTEGSIRNVALHLHDTHGYALANAFAGLLCGVTEFDASAGGIGGCPFVPGARGNVATESLVRFLHGLEIETGVRPAAVEAAYMQLRPALAR